uniref:Uncharacterized protein n=1 Tax=Globodera rostochiensis TaxID=31243 RepID=A0A914I9Q3_GLORO
MEWKKRRTNMARGVGKKAPEGSIEGRLFVGDGANCGKARNNAGGYKNLWIISRREIGLCCCACDPALNASFVFNTLPPK